MTNSEERIAQLTNTQLEKIKSAANNKIGRTLRITQRNIQDKELRYELYVTIRKKNFKKMFLLTTCWHISRLRSIPSTSLRLMVFYQEII